MSLRVAAVVVVASLLIACGSSDATTPPSPSLSPSPQVSPAPAVSPTALPVFDPSVMGPYAVGLQRLALERPSTADGSPRSLETWVWYPAAGEPSAEAVENAPVVADGRDFPLVIYSHGSGGRPEYQRFLTAHLASHGFIVAAPPHPGNTSDDCFPCTTASILSSARERPEDVEFVLDALIAMAADPSSELGRIIAPERTAVVGHSFGGWTALYAAASGRFDAAVAQAPGSPQLLKQRAASIDIPLMIIASEHDEVVPIEQVDDFWPAVGDIEKEYVLFPEGVHLNYVDRCFGCRDGLPEARGHELIRRYTTAWLFVHVVGDARYQAYLGADPPDAVLVP